MRSIRNLLVLCSMVSAVCLAIASSWAEAADLTGSTRVLCVLTNVSDCDSTNGCERISVEDVNLPRFFKIDVEKKLITPVALSSEMASVSGTKINDFQRMNGKIFLQGIEVRGWSMVISEPTGKLTLSASGDDEAFVLFGVCIPHS